MSTLGSRSCNDGLPRKILFLEEFSRRTNFGRDLRAGDTRYPFSSLRIENQSMSTVSKFMASIWERFNQPFIVEEIWVRCVRCEFGRRSGTLVGGRFFFSNCGLPRFFSRGGWEVVLTELVVTRSEWSTSYKNYEEDESSENDRESDMKVINDENTSLFVHRIKLNLYFVYKLPFRS